MPKGTTLKYSEIRGKRLREVLRKKYPNTSSDRGIAGKFLADSGLKMEPRTVTGWLEGRSIDNNAIGVLLSWGIDMTYVLTGSSAPTSGQAIAEVTTLTQSGEHFAKLLAQLAGCYSDNLTGSDRLRKAAEAALQHCGIALEEYDAVRTELGQLALDDVVGSAG